MAARALGLGLPRQVAGLVPARRQLAHLHRAGLRVDAAATTRVPGYDDRNRKVRAAVVHGHGLWIIPLPLRYYTSVAGLPAQELAARSLPPGSLAPWEESACLPNAHASFLASAEENAEKTRLRQEAVATVRQFLGGFREGR